MATIAKRVSGRIAQSNNPVSPYDIDHSDSDLKELIDNLWSGTPMRVRFEPQSKILIVSTGREKPVRLKYLGVE